MKVMVGSTNPIKVGAVEEAFKKYFPDCKVEGVEVESGVPPQPMSEEETIQGAKNRALASIGENEYGVGLEGGVCEIGGKMFECAWVCIVRKSQIINDKPSNHEEGLGGGLYFELPQKIAQKIRLGGELGPIMNEMTGQDNVKQKMGAIGIFSKGQLDRKSAYVQIVVSALIKFVSPEWF